MEATPELKYIFSNVNDWLKFAEAKHGALIILNTAMIVGILSSYSNLHFITYKPLIFLTGLGFGVSILISLLSLFPVTENNIFSGKKVANTNLYFFGHLAQLDDKSMIAELQAITQSYIPNKLDIDLINQILVNARIVNAKFAYFKFASFFTILGAGIASISIFTKIICHF